VLFRSATVANSDLISEDRIRPVYETRVVIEKLVGESTQLRPLIKETPPRIQQQNIEASVVTREPIESRILTAEPIKTRVFTVEPIETRVVKEPVRFLSAKRVFTIPLQEININSTRSSASITEMDKRTSLNIDRSTGIPNVRLVDPQTNKIVSPSDLKYEEGANKLNSPNNNGTKFGANRFEANSASTISYDNHSEILPHSKKLLSGFHPHYDEESDTLSLQCCTCCIGFWRGLSTRCSGCENLISCPIYCWVAVLLPLFVLLLVALVIAALYSAKVI